MKYITLITLLLPFSVEAGIKDYPKVIQALKKASTVAEVPYRLITAICFVESSFRPHVRNTYDGGSPSYGLCQIKEDTAREMGFEGKVKDLYDPFINSLYAAKYLRYQLDRYEGDWVRALSAYNAGHSDRHIRNDEYVSKVLKYAVQM